MSDEHKKKIGIPDAHELVQTDTKWEQRKGRDTDYSQVPHFGPDFALVPQAKVLIFLRLGM